MPVPPPRRPVIAAIQVDAWDTTVDVVAVGSGGSALAAAVTAADAGSSVLVLEKAATAGGTTWKSGGGVWVPGNAHMRALGLEDSRDGALRYMARSSRPDMYSPGAPTLGLPAWEYEGLCTFVDNGAACFAALERLGALAMMPVPDFPNYYTELDEDVHKHGRCLTPCDPDGEPAEGPELVRRLTEALERRGGSILLEHRVVSVVTDADRVIGVVAETPRSTIAVRAVQGVVFGSGGFTHNPELRRAFLAGPIFGGCAAVTNEGDFVPIAQALGAEMRNMSQSWNVPIVLERALAGDPELTGTFMIVGDSMLCVNRYGRRPMNEKTLYNEATIPMRAYDGTRCEYPNMLMFVVFDQANYDAYRGSPFDGGVMPARGVDDSHVLSGVTLPELVSALDERLAALEAATGGVRLAPDFARTLTETVSRFNVLARAGDDDLGRGRATIERHMHRLAVNAARMGTDSGQAAFLADSERGAGWSVPVDPDDEGATNPTMAPLADSGPYFAVILAPGMLDTKGGPRTDRHGRVLAEGGRPIPGLYAVGNCAGSPTAQGYWGPGGTLGPMITYAWLAGRHVASANRGALLA